MSQKFRDLTHLLEGKELPDVPRDEGGVVHLESRLSPERRRMWRIRSLCRDLGLRILPIEPLDYRTLLRQEKDQTP